MYDKMSGAMMDEARMPRGVIGQFEDVRSSSVQVKQDSMQDLIEVQTKLLDELGAELNELYGRLAAYSNPATQTLDKPDRSTLPSLPPMLELVRNNNLMIIRAINDVKIARQELRL